MRDTLGRENQQDFRTRDWWWGGGGGRRVGTEEINPAEVPTLSVWRNRQEGGEFHLKESRILEQTPAMRQTRLPVERTEASAQREAKE